jgi:AraC-like DNA-binding protein
MFEAPDVRKWVSTDRPGERVTIGRPLPGIEVLSATGSTRHWSEQVHETFTVAIVHRGERPTAAEWRSRGRNVTTAGGQLMSINAGDGHATLRVHAPSAFDAVKFAPSLIEDAARELHPRQPFRFRSPSADNTNAFRAIQQLVHAIALGHDPLVIESTCHEVARTVVIELAEAAVRVADPMDPVRDRRLRRAREYLLEHSSVRPSLQTLARETGLGKSQLCALFKKGYGTSIGQYWTGWRITKAKALLLQGIPAKYVAADLGFSDEAYFSRIFRRHNGLPPGAWVSLYRRNTRKSVCLD